MAEIKVGDRVRVRVQTRDINDYMAYQGEIGVVTHVSPQIGEDIVEVDMDFPMSHTLFASDLEPAPPADPKSEFLKELKRLLEVYHASIYFNFDQSDEISTTTIAVGEDSVKYSYTDGIDADNIMDYDK